MALTRHSRPIHRHGVTYGGTFRSVASLPGLDRTVLFGSDAPRPALVRLSQAFGVHLVVDYVGLAVKLPDVYGQGRDQDFILVSSPSLPLLRMFPLPAINALTSAFSSGSSYRAGGERLLFGARFRPGRSSPLDDLEAISSTDRPIVELLAARPLGSWRRIAKIDLNDRLDCSDNDLRFSPATTGGGIEAIGLVNALRIPIYRYFQRPIGG